MTQAHPALDGILVVCTANICRSPIAEHMLRSKIDVAVSSAGVMALVGSEMDPTFRSVALSNGLSCPQHTAKQLNQEMCSKAGIILVMEHFHREWISDLSVESRGKVFLLGKFINNVEISDPYKRDLAAYESAYASLVLATDGWAKILATAKPNRRL